MKKGIGAVLGSLLFLTACQEKEMTVSRQMTESGLPYILISMPGNSRVSFQIAWPNHWTGFEGKNQLTPQVGTQLILAGGAEGYGAGEVMEEFTDMNSEGYLSASADYVFGTLHYSPEYAEKTLKIANAHLKAPALEERWFRRVQDQLASNAIEAAKVPGMSGFEALRLDVLGDQPARYSLDGTNEAEYRKVTVDNVREWVKTVIVRQGVSIVIAGDLDEESANDAVESLFVGLPEGRVHKPLAITSRYEPKRILYHDPEATTTLLSFIGPMPPTTDGSEFEDAILISELRGINGVLLNAVRTELRASYDYAAGIDAFSRKNRFLILSGEVESRRVSAAEKIIRRAYVKFLTTDSKANVKALKSDYAENLKFVAGDTGSIAFAALMGTLDGFEESKVLGLMDELEAVSSQSVNERRSTAFPKESELIMVVSSPDPSVITDACVITSPEEVRDC